MAEETGGSTWRCAYCQTPIIVHDKVVVVDETVYCNPNCELMARNPERAQRARRGGGLVLSCNQCSTPIFLPEIMISRGNRSYCCLNCAEVAARREAPASAAD